MLSDSVRILRRIQAALALADAYIAVTTLERKRGESPLVWATRRDNVESILADARSDYLRVISDDERGE